MGNVFDDSLLRGKIKNNYTIIEKIDEDLFGEVYKCKGIKDNELVSIKIINKGYISNIFGEIKEQFFEKIRNEINHLKLIKNKYSIKLIDSIETVEFFNIVFDYYDSTLEQYLIERNCGLSIKEIKILFNKLNLILREIVIKGIIHADINLSNIKIKYINGEIIPLLSDYGEKIIINGKLKVVNSGFNFYAPELLSGDKYDNKVDLWSIGVILYSLYFNEYPYNGNSQIEIFNQIHKNVKKSSKNSEFNDLIRKLLSENPKNRITWDEYFNHNFWKINENEDEDCYFEEEYFGFGKKISSDINDLKKTLNMYNKKCIIYYGNNRKNNFNKLERLEVSYKDIISNKNFLFSSLIQKEIFQDICKLKIIDCNFSNLEILVKTPFENLVELDISNNKISNIEPLTKVPFKNLKFLSLCNNKISNLEPLIRVPFVDLKDLRLSYNEISEIDIFSKIPFKSLKKLILSSNNISNVSILKESEPLVNLTYLDLSDNKIIDINIHFPNLTYLDLSYNQISIIKYIYCKNLIYLNLGKNKIADIISLKEKVFSNLIILNLYDNNIKNIKVFSEVYFKNLKQLNLSYNEIEEIDILNNVPFQKLKILNLVGNEISNIGILTKVSFEELEELYINDNEIKYEDTINNKIISFLKEKYKFLKLIY